MHHFQPTYVLKDNRISYVFDIIFDVLGPLAFKKDVSPNLKLCLFVSFYLCI